MCKLFKSLVVYGQLLEEQIKSETSGDLETTLLALCKVRNTCPLCVDVKAQQNQNMCLCENAQ